LQNEDFEYCTDPL